MEVVERAKEVQTTDMGIDGCHDKLQSGVEEDFGTWFPEFAINAGVADCRH